MNDSYSILIIEDEKNILDFMSRTLKANDIKQLPSLPGRPDCPLSIHSARI